MRCERLVGAALLGTLVVLCVWLAGCSATGSGLPATTVAHPRPPVGADQYLVGAADTDITAPPGIPTGGHGPGGAVARGTWGRLHASAFWFEHADGSRFVLCQTDLYGVNPGLWHDTLRLINRDLADAHIAPLGQSEFALCATHTHHGPANFSSNAIYNDQASCRPGFDPEVRRFLARRIADAVVHAAQDASPARVEIFSGTADLARLRSYGAFLRNPDAAAFQSRVTEPGDELGVPIRSEVRVLRARRSDGRTAAIVPFFACHPTVVRHEGELYQSDFFGIAAALLRERHGCHAAVINGAEGDLSPRYAQRDFADALRLGRALADAVDAALQTPGSPVRGPIVNRFAWQPLADQPVPGVEGVRTADEAAAGVALMGGAEDGRTFFHELGWVEGVRNNADRLRGQGAKQPVLDARVELAEPLPLIGRRLKLSRLALPPDRIATEVPVGLHRLGSLTIATTPGEFTVVMGQRVRRAVAQSISAGMPQVSEDNVLIAGLCNEYMSYFTTPAEFDAQHYEGASTLYGPWSATLIAMAAAKLAESKLAESTGSSPEHWGQDRPGSARTLAYLDLHEPTETSSVLFSVLEAHQIRDAAPVHVWPRSAAWSEAVAPRGWSAAALAMPRVTATWTDTNGEHRSGEHDIAVICLGTDATPARTARFQAVLLRDLEPGVRVRYRVEGLDGAVRTFDREP